MAVSTPCSVAHCVRQQHGSMAQTSRIYLPTARYFVAERELCRDVSVIGSRKKQLCNIEHARLRCTSSIKIDCAYNCRKYTRDVFFSLDPSFLPCSILRASLRTYLRSRKTLKANATDDRERIEDESARRRALVRKGSPIERIYIVV